MLELFKLIVDALVLRDASRKKMLNIPMMIAGVVMVILLYATLLPAFLLWQKHPQYKPVFIGTLIFDAVMFLTFMFFAARSYIRQLRAQR